MRERLSSFYKAYQQQYETYLITRILNPIKHYKISLIEYKNTYQKTLNNTIWHDKDTKFFEVLNIFVNFLDQEIEFMEHIDLRQPTWIEDRQINPYMISISEDELLERYDQWDMDIESVLPMVFDNNFDVSSDISY